jgi:hypothetical protein
MEAPLPQPQCSGFALAAPTGRRMNATNAAPAMLRRYFMVARNDRKGL